MDNIKNQVISKIQSSNAILITVGNSPDVDQLSGCIALTLMINKLGKHGTSVFSGQIPSTIDFLDPQKNIEKSPDSLRDFIISFSKDKADKLKYKVEEDTVKIYITPYRSSLNESDFVFSQGEFNIDLIITLGIKDKSDIDQAIIAHGNILHDATIININLQPGSDLGNINLIDTQASSYCELLASISKSLEPNILDEQIATALLTGIVSETNRFSNPKTNPQTMSLSSELMKAGANPQLISTKLEEDNGSSIERLGNEDQSFEESIDDTDNIFNIEHNSNDSESISETDNNLVNEGKTDNENNQTDLPEPVSENLADKLSDKIEEDNQINADNSSNQSVNSNDSYGDQPTPEISEHKESNLSETMETSTLPPEDNSDIPNSDFLEPKIDGPEQIQQFSPPPDSWDKDLNMDHLQESSETTLESSDHPEVSSLGDDSISQSDSLINDLSTTDESDKVDDQSIPELIHQNGSENDIADNNISQNQTGLDPSLFTEANKTSFDLNDQAPPVPPPVVPLSFNNENQDQPSIK